MSIRSKASRRERAKLLDTFWTHPVHSELEVLDRLDHLKVTACSKEASTWWIGTLRVVYPQDHFSSARQSDVIKMHPEPGVTLQLNRADGTLRVKGKRHLQWFDENFRSVVDAGNKAFAELAERKRVADSLLRLDDGLKLEELMTHVPKTGAIRHGPTFLYRLWRGLLEQWVASGGHIYVITPLLDAQRLSDIILTLCKHRHSPSKLQILTMWKCDGDSKYMKVLEDAQKIIRSLKGPNKKPFVAEERLQFTMAKIEAKFGKFHCKMIAVNLEDSAEVLVTSANFHRWHFETESRDTVAHFRLPASDLVSQYIRPLGLEVITTEANDTPDDVLANVGTPSNVAFTASNEIEPINLVPDRPSSIHEMDRGTDESMKHETVYDSHRGYPSASRVFSFHK